MIYMNNCYYKGSVVNGLFSGGGTIILSNGNKYEGEFKDGKPNGKGI